MVKTGRSALALWRIVAYSSSVGGVAFLLIPAGAVLQDVYPRYYGLSFTTIGLATLISSIVIAIANPIIGIWSDRRKANGGTRRAWVVAGYLLFVLSGYHLFMPTGAVTAGYFTFWWLSMQLAWSVFDSPHLAWGTEIATNYHARTRLFGIRNCVVTIGESCFFALPLLPIFKTQEISPLTLKCAAVIAATYLVPSLLALCFVPEGRNHDARENLRIREALRLVLSNKPFQILILASIFLGIGEGMWMTLASVIYDYYYGIGKYFSVMYLCGSVLTAAAVPLLLRISARLGKKTTFASLQVVFILLIATRSFILPSDHVFIPLAVIMAGVLMVLTFNCIITQAILADVVDYGIWRFGSDQGASYYSVIYFFDFILGGLGGPLGLSIIDHLGFSARGITDIGSARMAINLSFCLVPILSTLLGLVFIWKMPICARRAAIIRRRIELRASKTAEVMPAFRTPV